MMGTSKRTQEGDRLLPNKGFNEPVTLKKNNRNTFLEQIRPASEPGLQHWTAQQPEENEDPALQEEDECNEDDQNGSDEEELADPIERRKTADAG